MRGLACVCPSKHVVRASTITAHCPPVACDCRLLIFEFEAAPITRILKRSEAHRIGIGGRMRLDGGIMSGMPQADVLGASERVSKRWWRRVNDNGALPWRVIRLPTTRGWSCLPTTAHDLIASAIECANAQCVRPFVGKCEA